VRVLAPRDWVGSNLKRRHLDETRRALVAARVANIQLGENQHSGGSAQVPILPIKQVTAAAMLNVSERSLRNAAVG
jgi:hypothetical protein